MNTDGTNQRLDKFGNVILATPNPDCHACNTGRVHLPEDWRLFHLDAGKGVDNFGDRRPTKKK